MLEALGLVVHAVPRHAEVLGEVELEQAVVADDLERELAPAVGERRRRGSAPTSTSPRSASLRVMADAEPGVTPSRSRQLVLPTAPPWRSASAWIALT